MFSGGRLYFYVSISLILYLNLFENCESSRKGKTIQNSLSSIDGPSIIMSLNGKNYTLKKKQLYVTNMNTSVSGNETVVNFEVGKQLPPDEDVCFSAGWNVGKFFRIDISTFNRDLANKTYDSDTNCAMTLQASKNCTPLFGCNGPISLRNRSSETKMCETDFLKIEDGLGGSDIFCGNEKVSLLRAAHGGRDLFVTFQSGAAQPDAKLHKGFSCYALCDKPGKNAMTPIQLTKMTPRTMSEIGSTIRTINENCSCGSASTENSMANNARKTGRIIGGHNVEMNEFPFLVPIVDKASRKIRCGGSIINSQFVLSAAHCFIQNNVDPLQDFDVLVHARVLALGFEGEVDVLPPKEIMKKIPGYELGDLSDVDEGTIRYSVVEKIFNPLFTSEDMDGDIVLLKLDRKIDFLQPQSAKPICLPEHSKFDDIKEMVKDDTYTNVKVSIAGWGKPFDNYSVFSRIPQKLEFMPMLNYSTCIKYLSDAGKITERMICSGFLEGGKDSCQGDSGSPLFFKESGGYYRQIGINSWGDGRGCALQESPGVYTDLRPLMQWIYFQTSQTEGVEWCKEQFETPENHVMEKNKTGNATIENARTNPPIESKNLKHKHKKQK